MGPIWRYRLVVFSWLPIGSVTTALLGGTSSAFPAAVAELFAIGFYSMTIKCPKCGKPVGRIGRGPFWNAFAPSRCGQCGHDLRKH
jgi:hypothetical protein